MKERWLPVGVIAGVLFVINVVARWVAKGIDDPDTEATAGFVALGAIGLVFFAMALYWGRVRPWSRVVADLAAAAVVGCLLSILVGPFLAGESPFVNGAGAFFQQVWVYGAIFAVGVGLGMVGLIAFAADYRAKQLKLFAERTKSHPRRV
ncbi:hypothetical protein Cme02nite_42740 [Catellatospora methionotrophica]|uniref:Uncharacterized protein n=1 Tax=Catellatospora methionotrophica TaxID=121620 RepID=A0A8J3L7Q0_9ACTN|nr:hypothetical protein [Catellatospora methionotrophica]GIG15942.1 hypothetical protein Cme02nite_42740 [Catellatospora methionotrophica]